MDLIVGLGHVDLVCRDLRRSLDFYRAVFGPLGLQEPMVIEGRSRLVVFVAGPNARAGKTAYPKTVADDVVGTVRAHLGGTSRVGPPR